MTSSAAAPAGAPPSTLPRTLGGHASEETEHRLALARALAVGGALYPAFFALDVYAKLAVYPHADLWRIAAIRAVVTVALFACVAGIRRQRVSARLAGALHLSGLVAAALGVAAVARELGGPASPYLHGVTIVILVRSAIVPSPMRDSLAHGAVVALVYPAFFLTVGLCSPADREAWRATTSGHALAIHYMLVCAAVGCGVIASHMSWAARRQLFHARRLGRYRLEAPLARGGQGEVWLARDAALGRNVALKLLRADAASPRAIRDFEREAKLASKLTSPHTVRVFDFGASDDGLHYIAMEHLVGHDLAELVRLFGPLPAARAVSFGVQACRSLEEAHDAGLVHRDVKPSNLFAAQVGDARDVVKLLDFGIARSSVEDPGAHLTRDGAVRGTLAYLAPERCKGAPATASSDIYSLGATLFFLVSGSPPFVGDDAHVVIQHREDEPERPSVRRGEALPPELEAIIMRCLAKSPTARFESAQALRLALEACDAGAWTAEDAERFWVEDKVETVGRWTEETRA